MHAEWNKDEEWMEGEIVWTLVRIEGGVVEGRRAETETEQRSVRAAKVWKGNNESAKQGGREGCDQRKWRVAAAALMEVKGFGIVRKN